MIRDWEDRERSGRGYGRREDYSRSNRSRDWSDRAGDEVRSWLGDDDAERRRRMDEERDDSMGRSGGWDRDRYRDDRGDYGGYGEGSRYEPYGTERGGYRRRDEDYGRGDYADASRSGMAGRGMGPRGYSRAGGGNEGGRDYTDRNYGGPDYGRQDYGRQGYGQGRYGAGSDDRGFFEKAGDEVASWFGDEDAQRRRERDAGHRGRGPRNYSRSDDRIREDVSDRLSDDRHIDASDIEVSVSGGEVTLDGTVENRFAKRHAEDLAESCSGVKHVQNNLRVKDRQGGSAGPAGASASGSGVGTAGGTATGGTGAATASSTGGKTSL